MAAVVEDPLAPTTDKAGSGISSGQQNGASTVPQPYFFQASHEYASASAAEMVVKTLSVDPELRPQLVTRKLSVEGSTLQIHFSATDAKTMQAAVGTFYDLLKLATETLEAFGPEADSMAIADGQT
ncbi:g11729 [Coccomyxa viridis]|uniref:G11729 protein n=1 Tax=Coccomyxa viridis TaxID=1274662 RepID=A0ABP1GB95_9CHLO